MKKIIILIAIVIIVAAILIFVRQRAAEQKGKYVTTGCSCRPSNGYNVEYPSTGNNQNGTGTRLLIIPTTDYNPTDPNPGNVKKIHLSFPLPICNATGSSPCYGSYKATIGTTVYSGTGSGQSGANSDIQIPINVLQPGNNTILITGDCGVVCPLPPLTVAFLDPASFTAAITLTKECCTSASGPHNTINYTGKARFKMGGTASPYTKLKIAWSGGSEIINFIADDGSGNGYTAACYDKSFTVTVLGAFGDPISGATINGSTNPYMYVRSGRGNITFDRDCLTKAPDPIIGDVQQ
jgi:hypothetical protein